MWSSGSAENEISPQAAILVDLLVLKILSHRHSHLRILDLVKRSKGQNILENPHGTRVFLLPLPTSLVKRRSKCSFWHCDTFFWSTGLKKSSVVHLVESIGRGMGLVLVLHLLFTQNKKHRTAGQEISGLLFFL